jgi:hypothetical protein
MSVQYILSQIGYKFGQNPSDSNQRATMLRFINSAAKEIYNTSDMAGVLREQLFKVNPNQTIAFPPYMGQLRAMRNSFGDTAINLSQMRPHYNQYNWVDGWKNWRLKGIGALSSTLQNQSILTISVMQVETPPVVVSVVGSTANSSRISETIAMSSTTMTTTNAFTDVFAFTKGDVNNFDVALLDVDNNQISYIPNNKLKAEFQIVDISNAPWYLPNSNPLIGWVEVLYKEALPYLSSDTDEFPAVGYDDVIVSKCLQLYFEEQKDIPTSQAYYQKANTLLAQIHEDCNRGTDDVVSLVENQHDRINPRTGFGRDWWQAYRIIGR